MIGKPSSHAGHFKRWDVEVIFPEVEDIASKLDCEALPALPRHRIAWILSFFQLSILIFRVYHSFKVLISLRKMEEIETVLIVYSNWKESKNWVVGDWGKTMFTTVLGK